MWLALGQWTVHIRYGTWEINSKDLMSDKYLNQEHIRRYWDNENELLKLFGQSQSLLLRYSQTREF